MEVTMNKSLPLWPRLRAEWRLKLALTALLNVVVGLPYYGLQHWQLFPETVMRQGIIDRLVAFRPGAVWLYLSLYLFMPLFPLLMTQRERLWRYAAGMITASLMANCIFLLWPTVCVRPEALEANFAYRWLTAVDRPFHAFPSLHAAFAVLSAQCGVLVLRELKLGRWTLVAPWAWAALIGYGALATKQHVVLDLAGGMALGMAAYLLAFRSKALSQDESHSVRLGVTRKEIS